MSRTACPSPKLAKLVTALALLTGLACLLSPATAQQPQERLVAAKGTHIFRRILHDLQCLPLENVDQLGDNPDDKVLIVLGQCDVLDVVPQGIEAFVRSGGAVLIATDQNTGVRLEPFGLHVATGPVDVPATSRSAYRTYGLFIQGDQESPLFAGLERVATIQPGYMRQLKNGPEDIRVLADLPRDAGIGKERTKPQPPIFAAGGTYGEGRILILADQSVFSNGLLWQRQGEAQTDNFDFARNCASWLTSGKLRSGKPKQVLFVDDGVVQTRFDIPLKEVPPPPPPGLESLVRAIDDGLYGVERENHFNEWAADAGRRIRLDYLFVILTVGLAVVGLIRVGMAKHYVDPATPRVAAGLAQLVPSVGLLDQRQRWLLRGGNFWEAGRELAQQFFRPWTATPAAPQAAFLPGRAQLPPVRVRGNWFQQRRLRRMVKATWRLAHNDRPRPISARRLGQIEARVRQLANALAAGTLEIGRPLKS
jgi:hypothetical protein